MRHPNVAVITIENIVKVHKIVLPDFKVKLQEIADILNILKEHVDFILHNMCPRENCF